MRRTISREEQEVRERRANTDRGSEFSAVDHLEEARHQPSAYFIGRAYERFLRMPVVVVSATLWLAGIAILGLCALMIYLLATSLVSGLTGA